MTDEMKPPSAGTEMTPAIEIILARQVASSLAVPILLVDPEGNLVFFNEAAEPILGKRFDETGQIRRGQWSNAFQPKNADGSPLPREEMPLFIATEYRRPAYRRAWITGLDGVRRHIEGIAIPLIGSDDRFLGALGIFWEVGGQRSGA
jgi:PAS domain-containing protein